LLHLLDEESGQIQYRSLRYQGEEQEQQQMKTQKDMAMRKQTDAVDAADAVSANANADNQGLDLESMADAVVTVNEQSASTPARPDPQLSIKKSKQRWVLGELLGRGTYKLLNIAKETKGDISFLSSSNIGLASASLLGLTPPSLTCDSVPNSQSKHNLSNANNAIPAATAFSASTREGQILLALEQAELAEQERIREWANNIPLVNAYHPKAFTCQDEFALDPLACDDNDDDDHHSNVCQGGRNIFIEQTPLVRKGLDRLYLLDQVVPLWESKVYRHSSNAAAAACGGATTASAVTATTRDIRHAIRTKDVAISLKCNIVDNDVITACIESQTMQERLCLEEDCQNLSTVEPPDMELRNKVKEEL
jgi:hypothetical protein